MQPNTNAVEVPAEFQILVGNFVTHAIDAANAWHFQTYKVDLDDAQRLNLALLLAERVAHLVQDMSADLSKSRDDGLEAVAKLGIELCSHVLDCSIPPPPGN